MTKYPVPLETHLQNWCISTWQYKYKCYELDKIPQLRLRSHAFIYQGIYCLYKKTLNYFLHTIALLECGVCYKVLFYFSIDVHVALCMWTISYSNERLVCQNVSVQIVSVLCILTCNKHCQNSRTIYLNMSFFVSSCVLRVCCVV